MNEFLCVINTQWFNFTDWTSELKRKKQQTCL